MNGQVELTQRTLRAIAHSLMVHARVLEAYIYFALIYIADHILPVLPIKYLISKDGEPTTPYKLATGTKPSILHLHVLFFACVVRKANVYVGTKALNMRHQSQNVFVVSSLESHNIKKGILFMYHKNRILYLPTTLFLVRVSLVRWRTRHNHMQKLWICDRLCHTYLTLHLQSNKLEI